MHGTPPPADLDGCESIPPRLPTIPDHEMIRCIGRGSYGEIWLVRNILGSFRAAKVIYRRRFATNGPFEREFRGIQNYEPISRTHEGLVQILQVGRNEAEGYLYYVMELADDDLTNRCILPEMYAPRTLEAEIRLRGRIPAAECVDIGVVLTSAIVRLHEQGLVHRDLKPANIIFINRKPRLADIGLVIGAREAKTLVGTPGFMLPDDPGSVKADIYGLGKVLYEMVMGMDRMDFPEPSSKLGQFPDRREVNRLSRIIHRACADGSERGYSSARAFLADLEHLQAGLSRQAKRGRGGRRASRGALLVAGLLSVSLVLGVFGYTSLMTRHARKYARELQVLSWQGPTNRLLVGLGPAVREGEATAWLLVPVRLTTVLVEPRLVRGADAPSRGRTRKSAVWWQCDVATGDFRLNSGETKDLAPVQILPGDDGSNPSVEVRDSRLMVSSAEFPESVSVNLIFEVPLDLAPEACTLSYQPGIFPVTVPLGRNTVGP